MFPPEIDLPENGLPQNDGLLFNDSGNFVAGIGDINGDGFDDVATTNYNYQQGAGLVSIIFGGSYNPPTHPSNIDGTNGFNIIGPTNSKIGYSVCSADMNGDGTQDIIIGAPEDGKYGRIYVVFGSQHGYPAEINLADLTPETGFFISGNAQSIQIGGAISKAGDFNQDGIEDLVFATTYSPYSQDNTFATVIYGSKDISSHDFSKMNGENGFNIVGPQLFFVSPVIAVANFGKISNNISGGIFISFENYAYAIANIENYQQAEFNVKTLDGTNGFVFDAGPAPQFQIPALSSAGDFNQDGIEDLAICIIESVAILYGRENAFNSTVSYASMNANDGIKITSEHTSSFGYSVEKIGGIGEGTTGGIIIGSPDDSTTYVIFNQDGFDQEFLRIEDLNGDNGFSIASPNLYSRFTSSISNAGKFTKNGHDSIAISFQNETNYPLTYVLSDFTSNYAPSPHPSPAAKGGSANYFEPVAITIGALLGVLGIGFLFYCIKHNSCKLSSNGLGKFTSPLFGGDTPDYRTDPLSLTPGEWEAAQRATNHGGV